jgi:hypothetical protein
MSDAATTRRVFALNTSRAHSASLTSMFRILYAISTGGTTSNEPNPVVLTASPREEVDPEASRQDAVAVADALAA